MWAGYTVGVSIGAGFGVGDVLFGHWFPPRVPCPGQCHCVVDTCLDTCAVWLAILQISAVFFYTYPNYFMYMC